MLFMFLINVVFRENLKLQKVQSSVFSGMFINFGHNRNCLTGLIGIYSASGLTDFRI